MYKIAVLDYRLHPDAQAQIKALASNKVAFPSERCPESEWIARTGDANIALITVWGKVDKEYLDACPNLKYIGLCGTSTANINLDELTKRGISFSNIVSGDKESVTEYFFMQLVSLARGAGKYQWKTGEEHELKDKRIGIIGLGEVGKAMSHMALAYKMKVSYFSPHRKQELEDRGLQYLDMQDLVSSNEIITVCSPTNVKVLGKPEFNAINPGSVLIQASSGSPFEASAFKNWIAQEGNFALFDMAAGESNYQIYKDLPRVMFSRAVAGDTYESDERRGKRAIENLKNFFAQQSA
jgi:phosphoglycerate dehydrogenase-like enzyme